MTAINFGGTINIAYVLMLERFRQPKSRTYTEDELTKAAVSWLRTGRIDPALGFIEIDFDENGHDRLSLISPSELRIHNAKVQHLKEAQTIFEEHKSRRKLGLATTLLTSIFK